MKKELLWVFSALALALGPGLVNAASSRNEGNPVGVVGEQHNFYLRCLLRTDPPPRPRDPFVILVDECGFDAGMTGEELSALYSPLLPKDPFAPLETLLKPWRDSLSNQQYEYLSNVEHILATQTPDEAQASLAELEREAVQSLGRDAADLAVLSGLSTARASLSFWTERLAQFGRLRAAPCKGIICIVLADIAGAVIGYIESGTILGALTTAVTYSGKAAL